MLAIRKLKLRKIGELAQHYTAWKRHRLSFWGCNISSSLIAGGEREHILSSAIYSGKEPGTAKGTGLMEAREFPGSSGHRGDLERGIVHGGQESQGRRMLWAGIRWTVSLVQITETALLILVPRGVSQQKLTVLNYGHQRAGWLVKWFSSITRRKTKFPAGQRFRWSQGKEERYLQECLLLSNSWRSLGNSQKQSLHLFGSELPP
jgi:hypothetical protein